MRLLILLLSLSTFVSQAQTGKLAGSVGSGSTTLEAYWGFPSGHESVNETLWRSGVSINSDQGLGANSIRLEQSGSNNQASLELTAGQANQLLVSQTNIQNTVIATLSGNQNTLIVNQLGDTNRINLGIAGSNNQFTLRQDGGDTMTMLGLQVNNTLVEVIQKTGANSLTLDNSALLTDLSGIAHLRIEQSGGATAVVQQGKLAGK